MNCVLYEQLKYKGNELDYYNSLNSYIHQVCVCQAKAGRLQALRHFICLNVTRQIILCEEQLLNKYVILQCIFCQVVFSVVKSTLEICVFLKSHLCFCHIFLPQVLIRRTGIPISLSVLYLTIARQLGVKLEPVNFPSHFLLRWCQGKEGWVTCWTLKLCPQWQKPEHIYSSRPMWECLIGFHLPVQRERSDL